MTKRILSLAPSTTAVISALGAARQLVGVSRYCKDLSDVSALPQLGDFWSASAEEVLRLKPDLIVGALPYKSEVVQKMIQTGIPFFLTHPKSFSQIYLDIRWLGVLTHQERRSEEIIQSMKDEILRIKQKTDGLTSRPKVYCEEWMKPLICSISWVQEMVEIAGGLFTPDKSGCTVTSEEVIEANPDIIILSLCGAGNKSNPKLVASRPGWGQIEAVKHRRIYALPDQYFNSPCQHLTTGLKLMSQIFHPEIFGPYQNSEKIILNDSSQL